LIGPPEIPDHGSIGVMTLAFSNRKTMKNQLYGPPPSKAGSLFFFIPKKSFSKKLLSSKIQKNTQVGSPDFSRKRARFEGEFFRKHWFFPNKIIFWLPKIIIS